MGQSNEQRRVWRFPAALLLTAPWLSNVAMAQSFTVDPDEGRNTFSAVFDAPLGERITAMSSAVGCQLTVDNKALSAGGHCSAALSSIKVDNEPTKTDHFSQWSTNKKSDPAKCNYAVDLDRVKLGAPITAGARVPFDGMVKVMVCGRSKTGGGDEKVTGTAIALPDGTLRLRVSIKDFNRESYGVSPKNTEGWLARVQQLAPVVSATGDIEVNVFATAAK